MTGVGKPEAKNIKSWFGFLRESNTQNTLTFDNLTLSKGIVKGHGMDFNATEFHVNGESINDEVKFELKTKLTGILYTCTGNFRLDKNEIHGNYTSSENNAGIFFFYNVDTKDPRNEK